MSLKRKTVAEYNDAQNGPKRDKNGNIVKYTPDEVTVMKALRESVPPPTSNTVMQKKVGKEGMDLGRFFNKEQVKFSKENYGGIIGGFTAKAEDAATSTTSYSSMREANRLDYIDSRTGEFPYPKENKEANPVYYVIRYLPQESDCCKFSVPYGEQFVDNLNDAKIAEQPFTGNGFTRSEKVVVPEYELKSSIMPAQASLYYVDAIGNENLCGIYDPDDEVFVK